MCFTVNVNIIKEELERRYGTEFFDHENYRPSYYYHAYALPDLPVIHSVGNGEKEIGMARWGLIPGWVKSVDDAEKIRFKTFNARSETIAEKPSFRQAVSKGRCLLPVAGFFEWQHLGSKKQPWYIFNPDDKIISLGAVLDNWKIPGGEKSITTFSVVTTEANSLMSEIHNSKKRMPLVLTRENEEKWLSSSTSEEVISLMKPAADGILDAYMIGPLINRRDQDRNTPRLIEKWKPGSDLFTGQQT